jgi:TonB family protein
VYGGTQAFDVRFMDVRIAALGNAVHPIVYRFPPGFTVESAYVATLGRQHCMIFSPWVSPYIVLQPPTEAERAAFVETATQSGVSDAGESTLVTAPACAHPNGAAEVVHPAMPDYPFAAARMEQTGTAQIFVWVLPNGAVANSGIYKSSGVASLDSSSLVAATQSTYKAQIYRCEAVAGEYLFRVEYRAR